MIFAGQEIVNVLQKFGYRHDRTRGDHAILKYTHPKPGEKRTVTVPLHDRVRIGTLQISEPRVVHRHVCEYEDAPFDDSGDGTERRRVGLILSRLRGIGLADCSKSTWFPVEGITISKPSM